ncbi:MAG: hypothetical protein QW757_01200 [Candidatus Woesearchaeota archaeon]
MFKDIIIGEKVIIIYNKKNYDAIIIDETKNTLKALVRNKKLTFLKKSSIIKINNKTIHGKDILKRPEDRIK